MELSIYLAHLILTSALAGIAWFRIASGCTSLGITKGGRLAVVGLTGAEAFTGLGLLFFPDWRASAFPSTLAVLAGIWILMASERWLPPHPTELCDKRRRLIQGATAAAWSLRVAILGVIAVW